MPGSHTSQSQSTPSPEYWSHTPAPHHHLHYKYTHLAPAHCLVSFLHKVDTYLVSSWDYPDISSISSFLCVTVSTCMFSSPVKCVYPQRHPSLHPPLIKPVRKDIPFIVRILVSRLSFRLFTFHFAHCCQLRSCSLSSLSESASITVDSVLIVLLSNQLCPFIWCSRMGISLKSRNSNQIVKWSSRLIGELLLNLASLYTRQVQQMGVSVLSDRHHPLYYEFQHLPSNRQFRVPQCTTKWHKNPCSD